MKVRESLVLLHLHGGRQAADMADTQAPVPVAAVAATRRPESL